MKVNYIEKDGKKLFTFHRHDFQKFNTGEFIDGGFDYIRSNTTVYSEEIKNLIEDIRKQYILFGEQYPICILRNFLIKKYFRYYINKGGLREEDQIAFEILAAEILYRNNEKKRKTKIVYSDIQTIS